MDLTTGLADRGWLQHQIETSEVAAVAVVDLDDFRSANEVFGLAIGDEILRECARRLTACLSPGSSLARVGDDEFGVLLEASVDPLDWGERVRQALRVPMMIEGRGHIFTCSVGIAVADDGLSEPTDLLPAADGALNRAKGRGGDRVEAFDPMLMERARRRSHINQELRRGLQARQFLVHYQPKVSMVSGLINGVEALVRWEHPVDGMVYPDAFIPVAEETGLIRELGVMVLRQACTDAVTLLERKRHDGPFTMSVNVSTVQLQDAAFVGTVVAALNDSGLDPHLLCLEVTESAVLGDSLRMESTLHQLTDLGVLFSIDDFGTGYSSLSYLRRLPVNELKIDRSFIVEMNEPRGRRMVAAICSIAEALDVEIVAEGVDDNDAIAHLRGWGCDTVQGFLYFKPQSLDKVAKAMRKDRPRSLPAPV